MHEHPCSVCSRQQAVSGGRAQHDFVMRSASASSQHCTHDRALGRYSPTNCAIMTCEPTCCSCSVSALTWAFDWSKRLCGKPQRPSPIFAATAE